MRKWIPPALIALALLASALAYPRLPDRVPTHWGLSGKVDGWSGRGVAVLLMPALMLFLWMLFVILPRIDPRGRNYDKFRGTYETTVAAVLGITLVIHAAMLESALGKQVPMQRVALLAVGALFVVIGNMLPRARPNWFFGIRTPWTLSSDRVWERTHRVGGPVMVVSGLVIMLGAFAPPALAFALATFSALLSAIGSVGYSYFVWRQERGGDQSPP
jgi:uncharacterized membrane protein